MAVTMPGYDNADLNQRVNQLVDPFMMQYVREHRGSISAEHGIGLQKPKYLEYSKSKEMIGVMR